MRVLLAEDEMRLLVEEEDGVTFAIATDVHEAEDLARGLALAMLAGLPVALAFAWLGGRRLAALAVRPVEEMTAAMEDITAESLDQRVPEPPAADEIQRHARVLNASLDRLERSYRQGRRRAPDPGFCRARCVRLDRSLRGGRPDHGRAASGASGLFIA